MAMLPNGTISEIVAALETADWPKPLRGSNVIGWAIADSPHLLTIAFFDDGFQISNGRKTFAFEGVNEIKPLVNAINCFRPLLNDATADINEVFAKARNALRTGRVLDHEAGFVPLSSKKPPLPAEHAPFPARALLHSF